MRHSAPITRDLVLIGGGHTHAIVLKMWGMNPLPGARLTLINPDPAAAYSGMLPGHIAGHYSRGALEIDLVRLARFAGARLILDRVVDLDLVNGRVRLAQRPDISFDVASLDIGVSSGMPEPNFRFLHVWPAKPLGAFAKGWDGFIDAVQSRALPPTAAVIGGGIGGAELAMSMAWRLRKVAPRPEAISVSLIETYPILLPSHKPALRRALGRNLVANGVRIFTGAPVVSTDTYGARLGSGKTVEAAFVAAVAGARPAPWLTSTGLALHEGFVRVDKTLRSISHPQIFAVGDCAHMDQSPRPKAGVFAVRQGPVLFDNLRAALLDPASGKATLKPYRPQGDYLKLISLGGKSAVAEKWGYTHSGPSVWRWKDQIDQQFMDQFSDLPIMAPDAPTPGPVALDVAAMEGSQPLCGGCGSKVGPLVLAAGLADLPPPSRGDVLSGPGDDAAILSWGNNIGGDARTQQVLTCDHFRAFTLDPYVLGQITANHALGDVWAMGAEPQAALASLILPAMSPQKQAETVREILAGVQVVLHEAGADLVGGHTSLGAELTVGLTVTGLCDGRQAVQQSGGQAGDRLILTRPLGVGVVMSGEMRGLAKGQWAAIALHQMCQSNGPASRILRNQAHAMTDVTGFGLAGHLLAMLKSTDLAGVLHLSRIAWMPGAVELSKAGYHSALYPQTAQLAEQISAYGAVLDDPRFALLFDPQTAGGLLAAVPADKAQGLIDQLAATGQGAWIIGELTKAAPRAAKLTVLN